MAELIVKPDTINIVGYSAISADLATIYGGIAGSACATTDGSSPCNSCIDQTGGVRACNQLSVYSSLKLSISFKLTKSVTGIAKLFIESASGVFESVLTIPSTSYTQDTSTVTLETTWSAICLRAGLSTSCTGGAPILATKGIRFGVDSDNTGEVEEAERKSVTAVLHYIPTGTTTDITQPYCATGSAGAGVCKVVFIPGDEKVFIDSAVYAGADIGSTTTGGSVDWESIAIFPIAVAPGGETAAYTSFSNGLVQPIFKTINPTDGNIPDSAVSGAISNYQKYCMVYATKNKAQNIYKFVTDATTAAATAATGCVTPAEVVGILHDKGCFIATAAFGSGNAPEVEIFRKFRNKFLATNFFGKVFIKFYYRISPVLAGFISGSDYLKSSARILLYPLVIFAFVSLKIGFFLTILIWGLLLIVAIKLSRTKLLLHTKKNIITVLILLVSPLLSPLLSRADEQINHPSAQEGLVRIKKDGTYIYDIIRPLKTESSRISFGQANYPEISISIEQTDLSGNPTGVYNEYSFQDFYNEDSGAILGYDYEWFPYPEKGRWGLQAGFSAMVITGNGKLVATPNPPSAETFTFVTLPLTLGGVYRLEWKDRQLFVPYASGGGTYVVLLEKREDKAMPSMIGSIGFYGAGGALLNVGVFDEDAGFQLDSEYGIGNMWLSLEFRMVEVNGSAFSFSNKYVNAGLAFDF